LLSVPKVPTKELAPIKGRGFEIVQKRNGKSRFIAMGFRAIPVTDTKAVKSVVEKFRDKYRAKDAKQ